MENEYKVVCMLHRIVPFSMTLSDPVSQFQGHSIGIIRSTPCLVLGWGFRGRWIECRYFQLDQIQTRVRCKMAVSSFMRPYRKNGTRYDQSYY